MRIDKKRHRTARAIGSAVLLACVVVLGPSAPAALAGPAKTVLAASVSSLPAWAKALGPGVTVLPPRATPAGHGSPGAALVGEVIGVTGPKPVQMCPYFEPSFQAECRTNLAGAGPGSVATFKHFALGYQAIDGDRALVGLTGTECDPSGKPKCASNHNPAAIFSSGKRFAALWAETVAAYNSTVNNYSLGLCIKVGGGWYDYVPPGS